MDNTATSSFGSALCGIHYSVELQEAFTRLSADYNPIHADPIAARRTMVGARVVHGIHHVLAGLEGLLAFLEREGHPAKGISGFSARFIKPVLVGETVQFHLRPKSGSDLHLTVQIDNEVMCELAFQTGPSPGASEELPLPPHETAREVSFAEAKGSGGSLPLGLDLSLAHDLFPRTLAILGSTGLAEVLALTRVVGMRLPGLHSLFSKVSAQWNGSGPAGLLAYQAEQTDERFSMVTISVRGPALAGHLVAFFRPPPEPQPGMEQVAARVRPGEFSNSIALILGGSRGLGEITAKIIAAGGGLPIITYHQGAADAENLARHIRGWGGECEVLRLDIRDVRLPLQKIFERVKRPATLYYFATPKIALRRGFFSPGMLTGYLTYYVTAFGDVLECLPPLGNIRVFYPSSIAVTEGLREMAEYATAKRAGEDLCAFYNRYSKNIKITVERLPRIDTDQTRILLPVPAENALDIMLPLIRGMENQAPA